MPRDLEEVQCTRKTCAQTFCKYDWVTSEIHITQQHFLTEDFRHIIFDSHVI